MQTDLKKALKPIKSDIRELQQRVVQIEDKCDTSYEAHNDLVEAFRTQQIDIKKMSAKLADMEDRSRRHNIKFRGIPESVLPAELHTFIKSLLHKLIPEAPDTDLLLDRAHRLPKPAFLPAALPRDVLARVHYFHTKESAMKAMRAAPPLGEQFTGISLYTDLSQATIQNRRNLISITKALRNHNIRYQWGAPSKLIVTHKEKQHVILTLDAGLRLLREWNIVPDTTQLDPNSKQPFRIANDWQR